MKNVKPSWDLTGDVFVSCLWRFCVIAVAVGFPLGVVLGVVGHIAGWEPDNAYLIIRVAGAVISIPAMIFALRGALAANFQFQKEPNQLPDPTSPPVTPPADAGGPPSVAADH
jgi:hypothetical protein